MNSRGRSSPPLPNIRTTPLRRDSPYDIGRPMSSPARALSVDYEDLSPISFHSRQSGFSESPFYERNDELRQFTTTPLRPGSHVGIGSNEPESMLTATPAIPRNLFAPEQLPSFLARHQSREDRLRLLRQDAMNNFLSSTASFIGEKLMVATDSVNDIYYIALSYFQQHQYERALEVLNKKMTLNKSVPCRYLAALCSLELDNGNDALDYLGHGNPFSHKKDIFQDDTVEGGVKLESVMCYARGKAYILLKDIDKARECFKEALTVDVKCYDALEALVKYNMLEEKAEWEFVMTLPYEEHCGADADYFRYLYGLKLKKDTLSSTRIDPDTESIKASLDVQLKIAERDFSENKYEDCLKICKEIKEQDAYFKESIVLHLSCLHELGMTNELFEYAQELVEKMNDEAVTWHAVGLFYLSTGKNLEARRYFSQALNIDRFFQQSWMGYGHSFAEERDYDQAIGAYMKCDRLTPGSHLPSMYIAMLYLEQNMLDLASEYFSRSMHKCDHDPFLFNEVAVYYYKRNMYEEAHESLHKAMRLAKQRQSRRSPIWEKMWCNLGHVYRHEPFQNYDRALRCFDNALLLNPKNADARTTSGMIHQSRGETARAIVEYHKVLNDNGPDELTQELLEISLLSNASNGYPKRQDLPCLNDSFDIFLMADSIRELSDEVEIELAEDAWPLREHEATTPINTGGDALTTEDDLIIDEGDLRPRT